MMKGLKNIVCRAVCGLALALLIAGCADVLSGPAAGEANTGTATLRVSLGAERTITPGIGQFKKILLSIEGQEGSEDLGEVVVTNGSASLEFPIGSWKIRAKAYIDDEDPEPAAVSAAHDFSWDGAIVSGDTLFVLEAAGAWDGTLQYTITVPQSITLDEASRIQVEVDGAAYEDLNGNGFTEGIHGIGADETDVTVTLPGGRYTVDILLTDGSGNAAAYRESVIILPGLTTELAFAPDAADFLDPAVLAALTDMTEVEFNPTAVNTGGILVDTLAGSPTSPTLAIEAPAGTETVYFTMTKTAAHSVAIDGAGAALATQVVSGEFVDGSEAGDELAVFKADVSSLNLAEDSLVFTLAVTEQGKTGVTVTVTVSTIPGLYIDAGSEEAEILTPVTDEDTGELIKTLQASLTWLAAKAESDKKYVILINQDSAMTTFASKSGVSGVRITLRGLGQERKVSTSVTNSTIFTISSGTTLALDKHITLGAVEGYQTIGTSAYLINANYGVLEMLPGSKISGNKAGGTLLYLGNGNFKMRGGSIEYNSATGASSSSRIKIVDVASGSFEMEKGAVITNNTLSYTGTINSNSAASAALEMFIAAVEIGTGTFTMHGGEISNNLRGVYIGGNGKFEMKGGVIRNNGKSPIGSYNNTSLYPLGGGVHIKSSTASSFVMEGGEISNNGQPGSVGSGIYVATTGERLALNGPVTITNNTIGFYKISETTVCYPYLGSRFSSTGLIGVDLVTNSSAFNNVWKPGQQFLNSYSKDPVPIDGSHAAKFRPVKCYTKSSQTITDVSSSYLYEVGTDGKIKIAAQ